MPSKFTYPFHYTPHPLCLLAAGEVQAYLSSRADWREELRRGKMFGVLVVRDGSGALGFLAAYSGNLGGRNDWAYFVPPVYDLLDPAGFFACEEARITEINRRIAAAEADETYLALKSRYAAATDAARAQLEAGRQRLREAKAARDALRRSRPLSPAEEEGLRRESQFQKAEWKRLEKKWQAATDALRLELDGHEQRLAAWRAERKRRSAALQLRLFRSFRLLNARGEAKDLCELFRDTPQRVPPAGAGECAAPKLLQYAYRQRWQPVAMAEFWWGGSPEAELRRHGYYYPACQGKCGPILKFMLQGLEVEADPLQQPPAEPLALEVRYEDAYLAVVVKPSGVLSVPGKGEAMPSVYSWARERYPEATGPLVVHRLDMATSGLLLIAKTKEVHQHLQAQFKNREVKKRYVALLDGVLGRDEGKIALPLAPDPLDRPRQVVDHEAGKPASTYFRVLSVDAAAGTTRVAFSPRTGRTHQLRVHAAHPQGLDMPILGDELYGRKAARLFLHAEWLEFTHPVSGQRVSVSAPPDF